MTLYVSRSVCLLMQVALPVMIFGNGPVRVAFRGGTFVEMAPPIDHYIMVSICFVFVCLHQWVYTSETWTLQMIFIHLLCRSICLLVQAALPCMLFANGPSRMLLKGGTNAEMAPQIDYLTWVLVNIKLNPTEMLMEYIFSKSSKQLFSKF